MFRHNLGLYDAIEYCECVCSDAYKVLYSLVSPCDYESVLDAHCTMSLLKKDDVLSKILYINDEGVSIEELVDATDQDEGLECIPTDWDDSLSKIEESMTQRTNSIEGISLLPDLIILAPPWVRIFCIV